MLREKFYIDVDGVLRDNLGIMVDLYNEHFNDNKTIEEINDFRTDITFPRIESETGSTASHWFFQEHSKEIFEDAKPYPYVADDIKKLREYGDVIIVTYQKTLTNKIQTLNWLEKNGIEYDGICFIKNKENVMNSNAIFIDDNDWNFCGVDVKCGVLIDAPYNKHIELEKIGDNCRDMVRCNNFHDFVKKYIESVNTLKKAEDEYLGNTYIIKESVPYNASTLSGEKEYFLGDGGDEVRVVNVYNRIFNTFLVIKLENGWGSVSVNVNKLVKYLIEHENN